MSKRLGLIVAVLVLVSSVVGCAPPLTEAEEATPTPFPTPVVPEKPVYEVQRGPIDSSKDFLCRVAPVREQELFFKMDGRVATVNVEKGDTVSAGDVLAELEVDDIINQSEAARVDLEKAQLVLEQAEADVAEALAEAERNLQIAEIKLTQAQQDQVYAVQQAEINLDNARIALARAETTDPQDAVRDAEGDLELARIALQNAQVAYTEAQQTPGSSSDAAEAYQRALIDYQKAETAYNQAVENAGKPNYDLALLQNSVREAELSLQQAQSGVDPLLQENVESARIQVERLQQGVDPLLQKNVETAQLGLDRINKSVDSARVVAPFDGEITGVTAFEGREATAYKAVVVIAEPGALELSCDLTSSVLDVLQEGMIAGIVFSDYPSDRLTGTVRLLPYPYGTGTVASSSSAAAAEDKSTRISIDDLQGIDLEPGQLAKVNVVLESKPDVLMLPIQAIRTFEGRRFVVVQEADGTQRRVDVKVGITSADQDVEITEGVEEGWIVVGP
ncbi:MAG: efflux RND transporter periplasmic adaptor subunit [Anaerolineae bacterium]